MVAFADQIDRTSLAAVCREFHVRRLLLFGSIARGEDRPTSDVDLLVEYDPAEPVTYLDVVDLSDRLRALFGEEREVDLVTERSLHPLIRKHVLRDIVVLYEG